MFSKMNKLMPTVVLVIVAVVVSMLLLNFFKVDLNDTGLSVLNRSAKFEGMCNKKHKKKEGMDNMLSENMSMLMD